MGGGSSPSPQTKIKFSEGSYYMIVNKWGSMNAQNPELWTAFDTQNRLQRENYRWSIFFKSRKTSVGSKGEKN